MARNQSAAIEGLLNKGVDVISDELGVDPVTQGDRDIARIAAEEAFMAEPVKVMIMSTTDVNAPPYADINVNGDKAVIPRGRPTVIKRKHLEVLARMKETRWLQQVPEGWNGAVGMESLRGHTALAYPFTIVSDTNPRGAVWLENILLEAS